MGCFKPLTAHRLDDGSISFSAKSGEGDALKLPCGQCIGCRIDRSKMWAVRCMHEASLYDDNIFITLTYADEYLPENGNLDYSHFQKFMKRLRKRFSKRNIRFYMCGEYGEQNWRPHFHAILFNFKFEDLEVWKKTGSGSMIYRSKVLEELWPFGHSSVGDVTLQSAGYVARYVMKKINGDLAKSHYERVNVDTGEVVDLVPEFNRMSLKPGIAQGWFDKFYSDVYPRDAVVLEGGQKMKPPKYYDLKYDAIAPYEFEAIQQERILRALARSSESTPERLAVKEEVLSSKAQKLFRSL
ncbi:replication initiator protein [Microviridae sp.]|nr:replication initiator protein [Microviridae sp.]